MPFERRYDKQEAIPERLRSLYVGDDDNGWEIDEDAENELNGGLKSTLGKVTRERDHLRGLLPEDVDAEQVAEMLAENKRLKSSQDVDALRTSLLESNGQRDAFQAEAGVLYARNQILEAALEAKAHPHIANALTSRVRATWKEGRWQTEVLDIGGEVDMDVDQHGQARPKRVAQLVAETRNDPVYGIYYEAPERNGGDTRPSSGEPKRRYTQEEAAKMSQAEYERARAEGLIEGL